ncbi:fatty acid desaturase [Pontiella agarivorans]|uniref:Fatty acid desaturase n=1 Tax=Pontiella agarivorans TaxID=3038953 RepID=A0ABU5N1S1_9BACT|nr:fatty acid desaturase [Pontiella agarivorans]MDZ8120206.1 fatty acid desaturase [Pontiella agarivorans]
MKATDKPRWYKCDVPKEELKQLMRKSDIAGIIHTALYLTLLIGLGTAAYFSIGTVWMIPAFFIYGTVYCFWNHMMHETFHGTPFKNKKLNGFWCWISSFFNGVEMVHNRYGHLQHHNFTYYEEDDPEIEIQRTITLWKMLPKFIAVGLFNPIPIARHALGILDKETRSIVPKNEWNKMIWSSRWWLLGHSLIIASCFIFNSWLPAVYTIFARFYGAPLGRSLDLIQHIGMEVNVRDHRLCTRDVYLNPLTRFLYWNMNYHIEHHMFPAVPFHALPKLHEKIKTQLPETYSSWLAAYREIISTVLKQQKDPTYCFTPKLPEKTL